MVSEEAHQVSEVKIWALVQCFKQVLLDMKIYQLLSSHGIAEQLDSNHTFALLGRV